MSRNVSARGAERRVFPWGDELDGTRLNYCDVNCDSHWADGSYDDGYADTAPVGSYPAGASWCGAQNLTGNVWEWTADWYGEYDSWQQENPTGPSTGGYRVMRGGGWDNSWTYVRAADRSRAPTYARHHYFGFRCASSAGE